MKAWKLRLQIGFVAVILCFGVRLGEASTFVWNGAVNGDWSNPGNWTNGAAPTSTGTDDVWLMPTGNAPVNQDIAGLYINVLTFNTNNYTVGGNAITLKNLIDNDNGANFQTNTLNCGLILAANNVWTVHSRCLLIVNGSIGETNGSHYFGAGWNSTVILNGSNTFTGGVRNDTADIGFYNDQNLGATPGSYVSNSFDSGGGRWVGSTGGFSRVTIHQNRGWRGGGSLRALSNVKLIYNAPIVGTGAITLGSAGDLFLGGDSATYAGNVTIGGMVTLMHSNALGASASRNLTTAGGTGNLDLNGYNLAFNIDTSWSSGKDGRGAIINSDPLHPSTISGDVKITSSTYVLPFGGPGDIIVTGVVYSPNANPYGFLKTGSGTLTLKGANTYTNYTSCSMGGLTLDYTVQNNNKVGTNAVFYLTQCALRMVGNDSTSTTQSIGTLSLGIAGANVSGAGSIRLESGVDRNLTLAAQGIVFPSGTYGYNSLDVTVVNSGAGVASLTTTNVDGMLAGGAATYNQSTWAKVVSGVVTGMADGEYVTTFPGGTVTTPVDVPTGATTIGADATVGTLRFNAPAGSTLSISNGVTLTLNGLTTPVQTNFPGILMTASSGPVSIKGPGIIQPDYYGPFFIHQYSTNPLTLEPQLYRAWGTRLLKCGPGELILTGTNTIDVPVLVYGGTLTVSNLTNSTINCPIGIAADLYLANATFKYSGPAVSQNHRILLRGPGTIDASGSGLLEFSAATDVSILAGTDSPLTLTGTGTGQMDGLLDIHLGNVIKTGSGTWTIGGTQPYTGNTIVSNGTLRLTNNCILARNLTVTSGGTLAGSASVGEDLVMNGTRRVDIRGDADYDTLTVTYDATLGGTLDIHEINGYRMPANLNMSIVSAGGTVSGTFTTLTGGFKITPSADGKSLLLSKRYPGFIFFVQ